ncbi:S9 family peptidase [Snodgrassella sp. B3882]|uniref:prolyl oligopeptidase family serine peptidase n=1 Tax=Snodgrassella sp. B3882 TaxID=2818037 RepID=UPI00226ABF2E|nr:prolyl oligopeptidase family serine peptidase [Snodgrassella sp. B3882]MCX8744295.1 S9 family peptidase [Snodgrassella sp. B3882]
MLLRKKVLIILFLVLSLCVIACSSQNRLINLEKIVRYDPYNWMETEQEKTHNWLLSESDRSIKILEKQDWFASIEKRYKQLTEYGTEPIIFYIRIQGNNTFYFKQTAQHPYNRLFVKDRFGKETLLIDPPAGYGIYDFYPSYDGQYIAYSIAENGSNVSTIKVFNLKTRTHLADHISGITDSNLLWGEDNLSFFYHRNNLYHANNIKAGIEEIYFHRLGSDSKKDIKIFGKDQLVNYNARTDQNTFLSLASNWAVACSSSSISGYNIDLYRLPRENFKQNNVSWEKIIDRKQNVTDFLLKDDWLFLAKYNDYSGYSIFRVNLNHIHQSAEKIIEWQNGDLTNFVANQEAIYVTYHDSGQLKFVSIPFADIHHIKTIPISNNNEVTAIFTNSEQNDILFTQQSWTSPPKIFRYHPNNQLIEDSKILRPDHTLFSEYDSEQKWVKSNDGTLIPLTLIYKKGMKFDRSAPTWLTAYGAYGESEFPNYDASRLIWLEKGGIIAIAHVRGGGELGPKWHDDGTGYKKQNSINDFIKCAEYLIHNQYTQPSKLVISGNSAGGIVIGMALIKRPDLFAAASIKVGMLNMSRLDKIPIGMANFEEFGSPFKKHELENLVNIDTYLNLKEGVKYPNVMVSVGLKDDRVPPWQSAKFAAKLNDIKRQQDERVLIITDQYGGHFMDNFLYMMTFFLWKTHSEH